MTQPCVRCASPAAAVMHFSYDERQMWIGDVQVEAGYPLCVMHCERLSPPRGWTLSDQRTVIRLFAPLEVA
ncbi:MAG TPA: DUF3499 family protein [Acidimicrobiia bacterium]